jgi:predicted nucleic acid-binding protein
VTVLADTGGVYALLDRNDAWHQRVLAYWERHAEEIRLPEPILAEVCYLVGKVLGTSAENAFVRAIADGEFPLEQMVADEDVPRAAALMQTYRDASIGFVDSAIVAAAERIDASTVLTTDRRHFPIIRPRHLPALVLVP